MEKQTLRRTAEEAIRLIYAYNFEDAGKLINDIGEDSFECKVASASLKIILANTKYSDDISRALVGSRLDRISLSKEQIQALEPWLRMLFIHANHDNTFSSDEIIKMAKEDEEKTAYILALSRLLSKDIEHYSPLLLSAISDLFGKNDWRYILSLVELAALEHDYGIGEEKAFSYINEAYDRCINTYGQDSPYLISIFDTKALLLRTIKDYAGEKAAHKEAFITAEKALGTTNIKYREILYALSIATGIDNNIKDLFLKSLDDTIEKYGEYSIEALDAYKNMLMYAFEYDEKNKEKYGKIAYERAKVIYKDDPNAAIKTYLVLRMILKTDRENGSDNEMLKDFFFYLLPLYREDTAKEMQMVIIESFDFFRKIDKTLYKDIYESLKKDDPFYLDALIAILKERPDSLDLLALSKEVLTLSEKDSKEYCKAKIAAYYAYSEAGYEIRANRYLKEGVLGLISLSVPFEEYSKELLDYTYLLRESEKFDEANEILLKYYNSLNHKDFKDLEAIGSTAFEIATNFSLLDDLEEFLEYSRLSYNAYCQVNGENSKEAFEPLLAMANAYIALDNIDEGKKLLEKASKILEKQSKEFKDKNAATLYYLLSGLALKMNKFNEAYKYADKAIDEYKGDKSDMYKAENIKETYHIAYYSAMKLNNKAKANLLEKEYKTLYGEPLLDY